MPRYISYGSSATGSVANTIKRINERIADIARTFGTESAQYENYENIIGRALPPNLRGESRAGYAKIQNSKAAAQFFSSENGQKVLAYLSRQKTRGQIMTAKKKAFKKAYGKSPTKQELEAEIQAEREAKKAMEDGRIKDRYEELSTEEIEMLEKSFNSWEDIRNIFAGMNERKNA